MQDKNPNSTKIAQHPKANTPWPSTSSTLTLRRGTGLARLRSRKIRPVKRHHDETYAQGDHSKQCMRTISVVVRMRAGHLLTTLDLS